MSETQRAQIPLREYETIYVMRGDVPREAAEKVAARVEEAVGREGGQLTQVEAWGRRLLAYPVAKQSRGVYVYVRYTGQGPVVTELERNLRMLDSVLKYQTVQLRNDVQPGSVTVDPERVKFAPIEPLPDDEVEESLERRLGLEDYPHSRGHHRHSHDHDQDDDDDGDRDTDDSRERDEAKTESNDEEE